MSSPYNYSDPDWWKSSGGSSNFLTGAGAPRCASSHKPITIDTGTKTYEIRGGSVYGIPDDAEVVVAFDWGFTPATDQPWNKPSVKRVEVKFEITDGQPPKDLEEFKRMLAWLERRVKAGRRVFLCCIGGHGRTGLVLAALVHKMTGRTDAVAWLRDVYCKKAVETTTQMNWLNKHYAQEKAEPSKSYGRSKATKKDKKDGKKSLRASAKIVEDLRPDAIEIDPIITDDGLFGPEYRETKTI